MTTFDKIAQSELNSVRKPIQYSYWLRSRWFFLSLFVVMAMATFTGLVTGAPSVYVLGQIVLGLSVYVSLFFLSDRQLINPIQAFVATIYWWFGIGPAVLATWNYLLGIPDLAMNAQVSGMEALWVVAPGLLIYAVIAKLTLNWFSRKGIYAHFLLPNGDNYRPIVLVIYASLMGVSIIALAVLNMAGIHGLEETSFFGGTKTNIWWVGVIAAIGSIAPFVSSALMKALASPWKKIPFVVQILIVVIVAQTIVGAIYGGAKSPIAILGAYFTCAYIYRFQRPPWMVISVGALVFLFIITPFVGYGRVIALNTGAETSAMRKQVYSEILKDSQSLKSDGIEAVDIAIFFRGIYALAGELTRRNGFLDGEWHGDTIAWGFEILIPRALMPGKRDLNIGNFFARTVGADIGSSNIDDTLNNVAISIPFEFVGNYGWGAGILSFGIIGFLWTLFSVWMLSPERLSNHPLTPFLAVLTMGMESSLGSFLAGLRELIIPLLLCYSINKILRGRI